MKASLLNYVRNSYKKGNKRTPEKIDNELKP